MTGERTCPGCGGSFTPENPRATFCSSPCRQLAYRRRTRGDAVDAQLYELVWDLRRRDEIDGLEAVWLLVFPPAEVRRALQVVAA